MVLSMSMELKRSIRAGPVLRASYLSLEKSFAFSIFEVTVRRCIAMKEDALNKEHQQCAPRPCFRLLICKIDPFAVARRRQPF